MIVQPVPVGPRSRRRRRLGALLAAVPAVLLAGAVGVGLAGPRPEVALQADEAPRGSAAVPPATAAPSPSPPSPDPRLARALPSHPSRVAGLPVRTTAEALALRRAGDLRGLVAIAGFLGLRELPESCSEPRLGPYGAFCTRTGILAGTPFTAGTGFAELGEHLHPQVPVGVRVPHAVAQVALGSRVAPAVVVLARFDDPRARRCLPAGRHCGEELVVERVAWIEGEAYPRTVTVDPDAEPAPEAARLRALARRVEGALPEDSLPLATALVRPGTITYLDPAMAAVVASLGGDPVWYARGLAAETTPAGPRVIAWVIADPDGRVLQRGTLPILPDEGGVPERASATRLRT